MRKTTESNVRTCEHQQTRGNNCMLSRTYGATQRHMHAHTLTQGDGVNRLWNAHSNTRDNCTCTSHKHAAAREARAPVTKDPKTCTSAEGQIVETTSVIREIAAALMLDSAAVGASIWQKSTISANHNFSTRLGEIICCTKSGTLPYSDVVLGV